MTQKERRRENRRKKHQREALIEMRNMYGNKDLTPYTAVLQIRTNGKATIRLSELPIGGFLISIFCDRR